MKTLVNIRFGKSSSCHFGHAVRLAASLPGYRQQGEGRHISHHVEFEVSLGDDYWDKLERLIQLIAGWRSASIDVAGRIIRPRKLLRSIDPNQALLWTKVQACGRRSLLFRQDDPDRRGKLFRLSSLPWRVARRFEFLMA